MAANRPVCEGIIPANTGKITRLGNPRYKPADHPREYGENTWSTRIDMQRGGSSPRIRGKSISGNADPPARGIIPANTGKITVQWVPTSMRRDHPREYGENSRVRSLRFLAGGSSPRIRGKFHQATSQVIHGGIIPANTGKIPVVVACCGLSRDHPREYGENTSFTMPSHRLGGSSPRIRGKFYITYAAHPAIGIIPANTGKIHTRLRGECARSGSSPRIRGK